MFFRRPEVSLLNIHLTQVKYCHTPRVCLVLTHYKGNYIEDMKYNYTTTGTCSRSIDFEVDENGYLHNVSFVGGCNGNLKGIGALVEGQPVAEVIARLEGIKCGVKGTSCPDQLALALKSIS